MEEVILLTNQSVNEELVKIYKEQRNIIRDAMNANQLVLFVGAGASIDSGMPTWKEATAQINEKLEIHETGNNLLVPQYYYNTHGKKEYTELMQSIFKFRQPLVTNDIHNEIVKFNVNTIITTNYDHLIEDAFEKIGQSIQVISKDKDLPYANDGKILIKMHGDFENDNFVLKEDDYLNYTNNFRLIENYVKSIIGTKTILFIGYSLSDPDVKQIINWVKSILNNDFRRAYLINASTSYSKYENEYFKNLGVDIIYSQSVLDGLSDNNIGKNTKDTLSDILKNNQSTIDKVSAALLPLKDLNYISNRYLKMALSDTNIFISNNTMQLTFENTDKNKDNRYFCQKLCESFNNTNSITDSRYSELSKILIKGPVKSIFYEVDSDGHHTELDIKTENHKMLDLCMSFDFEKMDLDYQTNCMHLSDNTPNLFLQNAYIDYINERYLSSYNNLNQASRIYFHLKSYTWYFICQVNLHHLGKILNASYEAQFSKYNIKEIIKACEQIDLYQLINSLPKSYSKDNTFFTDLMTLSDLYSTILEADNNSEKILEEATHSYLMYSGKPSYSILEAKLYDQISNQISNYIMNDRYMESSTANKQYLKSILSSYATSHIESPKDYPIDVIGNIKKESFNNFDIYLLLKTLITPKKLSDLINQFNITHLNLDKNTLEYLKTITVNITNTNIINHSNLFWMLVQLLAYTDLTTDIVEKILTTFNTYGTIESFNNHKNTIAQFLFNAYKQDIFTCNNEKISKLLKDLCYKSIYFAINNKKAFSHLSILTAFSCYYHMCGGCIDDQKAIEYLFEEHRIDILTNLYFYSSKSIQRYIQNNLKDYKFENNTKSYVEYSNLVIKKIIDVDNTIINNMFTTLEKLLSESESSDEVVNSPPGMDILIALISLYQNQIINDKDKLMQFAIRFNSEELQWRINPEHFNYDNFDIHWLKNLNKTFLEKLSSNKILKLKILNKYKDTFSNALEDKLQEIMLEYFI